MLAVILAAGRGTRLRPLTDVTPKGLVDIGGGKPLLEATLEALPKEMDRLVIVVGHLGDQIQAYFGSAWHGIPIDYVVQDPIDGTGTAVRLAQPYVSGSFLVVNGDDVYAKADLARLITHPLAILVQTTPDPLRQSARVSPDGFFLGLAKSAAAPSRRVCGAYVLDERFFAEPLAHIDVRDHRESSLPHALAALAKHLPVHTEEATYWRPVGTPEELADIRAEIRA